MTEDGNGSGTIVMINGSPTDNNATLFKKGAHSVFDTSDLKIGAEYDTPDWSPDKAQTEMDQAITKLGKNGFQGSYNANDGTAGGAIAAMKSAGINPSTIPSTGQDAELAAIQRILIGEQYMTVYKAIKPRGRGRRRPGRRPRPGQRHHPVDRPGQQRPGGRAERAARARRGDGGQHQRHHRRGRLLDRRPDLHAALRGGLHGRPASRSSPIGPSRAGDPRPARALCGKERLEVSEHVLDLRGVNKRFGAVQALTDVDFHVDAGEVVALVGDNGAGKSTLVKTISGVNLADSGEFRFLGKPASIKSPIDATSLGIATVYQDLALADNLDVAANLFLGHEDYNPGPLRWLWMIDDIRMEKELERAHPLAVGPHPQRHDAGRLPLGRAAPDRRPSPARCWASRSW